MFRKKIKWPMISLMFLLLFGFFYRIYGLSDNHSFWTDEDHVAIFSRAVLERGRPILKSGFDIGVYQLPMYWLGVLGMKVFGQNEIAFRWPSLVFGALTIGAVYFLATELFSEKTGFLAAFLTAFLNIEILWSIQARPYQAVQFFWVLGSFFSFRFLVGKQKKYILGTIICGLASEFFHPIGGLFLFSQLLVFLVWMCVFGQKKKNLGLVAVLIFVNLPVAFYISLNSLKTLFSFNNFFYYRIFLFKNYLPLIFFSSIGAMLMFLSKKCKHILFLFIPLAFQLFIVSFFMARQPFTRYFYPIFPYLILLASYGITEVGDWILSDKGNIKHLISSLLILVLIFSLWKTGKLSLVPQKAYSLNSDMQEIPEVDWKKLYLFVGKKLELNPNVVLAANWMDTPVWFLGEGRLDFLLRKSKQEVNLLSGAKYVNSFDKFLGLIGEKPAGILVLDSWDDAVPEGIREYCHNNLKLEFEIDRLYPVQPRYWTVWVYSWGIR